MRQIKFRMFDEDGYMTYPVRLDFTPDGEVVAWDTSKTFGCNGSSVWLMQSTGLKDRSGREIYEGDIVSSPRHVGLGVILYSAAQFCVCSDGPKTWCCELRDENTGSSEDDELDCDEIVVVGNIFENVGLLEDATDFHCMFNKTIKKTA